MNGWFFLVLWLKYQIGRDYRNSVGLRSLFLLFAFLVLVLALAAPRIWGISRRTLAVHRAAKKCKNVVSQNSCHCVDKGDGRDDNKCLRYDNTDIIEENDGEGFGILTALMQIMMI